MVEHSETDQNQTEKTLAEIKNTTSFLSKKFPEIMKAFYQSFAKIDDEGALSKKTKRLISLSCSLVKSCHWCVVYYVNKAFEAGATTEEILEASLAALKMNGGPGLMHVTWVLDTLKDLGKI
ncbi:MAG: carboxymuconolactone decarboxylase family protein [Promethearchaeota archaeon]